MSFLKRWVETLQFGQLIEEVRWNSIG